MSNDLFAKATDFLTRASRASNETESKMLVEQANKIFRSQEFLKETSNGHSSNICAVDSSPGNTIASLGHAFGNMGYGYSHGGTASWS